MDLIHIPIYIKIYSFSANLHVFFKDRPIFALIFFTIELFGQKVDHLATVQSIRSEGLGLLGNHQFRSGKPEGR